MANLYHGDDTDNLSPVLAIAGLASAGAGIWALFNSFKETDEKLISTQRLSEIQSIYNQAIAHNQRGEVNQAIQLFFQVLQRDPNHAPTYNFLAWIYAIYNYQLEQALAFAYKALELATTPLERACYLDTAAEVHARKGELERAEALSFEFLKTLQKFNQTPSSPVTYFRLAWRYQSKQDFHTTYHFLEQALQIQGLGAGDYATAGDVFFTMGSLRFQQELYNEAYTHFNNARVRYEQAVNIARSQGINDDFFRLKSSISLTGLGSTLYWLEDYQNSWLAHQAAYNTYPSNPYPPINLAISSAYQRNKQQMLYWLGIGIPLIIDNPPFFQSANLVSIIINDINFETYRDDVVGLLVTHGKISLRDYKSLMKDWYGRQKQPSILNQQNIYGSVGAAAGNVEGSFISHPQGI